MVEEFRDGDVKGDVLADDFEIDADAAGLAASGEVLADCAEVQFFAQIAREVFEGGDVAAFADERAETMAESRGEFRIFNRTPPMEMLSMV